LLCQQFTAGPEGERILKISEHLANLEADSRMAPFCVKTRSLQEWVGHLEPKFQGEWVVPGEYFFWFLQN